MNCCRTKMYFPSDAQKAQLDEITETNNIVLISYSVLAQNKEYRGALPPLCRGCGAALCMYSILHSKENYYKKMAEEEEAKELPDEQKVQQEAKDKETDFLKGKYVKDLSEEQVGWICEFCGVHNRVSKDVRAPETNDELYILKKVMIEDKIKEEEKTESSDKKEVNVADDTMLVFCIDVSGSMKASHHSIKDGQNIYPRRIQLITDAVLKQIEQMKKSHPNRRVGVVSFDTYVTLHGDCTKTSARVNGSVNNFESVLKWSKDHASILNVPLKKSANKLERVIKSLIPGSSTALGPGLLCALGIVQRKPGSRIILCTDGLANVGIGSLSENTDSQASEAFYQRVGDIAVESGVSISIITVEGNACRVDALGPLTDRTAGTILRVNPANMDLSEIASNSVIATNVKLKAIMHEGLAFQNEAPINLVNNGSILVKNVGSVTENNEAYFEYKVKDIEHLKEAGVNLDEIKFIPLQSQITYTDLRGNKFIRILSKQQELTKSQQEAEREVEASILTGYVTKETANLALQGKTEEAKKKKAGWMGFMEKVAKNAPVDDKNHKVFVNFKAEDIELNDLIMQSEQASMSATQRDEIASKLYQKKQMKKK